MRTHLLNVSNVSEIRSAELILKILVRLSVLLLSKNCATSSMFLFFMMISTGRPLLRQLASSMHVI